MAGQPLEPGKYILYFLFDDGYEIGHPIEIIVKEADETEAPQTFDFGVIGALAAVITLAAAVISRKRRYDAINPKGLS